MKIVKASKTKAIVSFSKADWLRIGKQAGWLNEAFWHGEKDTSPSDYKCSKCGGDIGGTSPGMNPICPKCKKKK